jgi:hypothetical protein
MYTAYTSLIFLHFGSMPKNQFTSTQHKQLGFSAVSSGAVNGHQKGSIKGCNPIVARQNLEDSFRAFDQSLTTLMASSNSPTCG